MLRNVIVAVFLAAGLGFAFSARADHDCLKNCGAGGLSDVGHRDCDYGVCHVTLCNDHYDDCGYDDNFNDVCLTGDLPGFHPCDEKL